MSNKKPPKPIKVGNSYRIQTMINGKRYSANKATEQECLEWFELLQAQHNKYSLSLFELLEQYRTYSKNRIKSSRRFDCIINTFVRDNLDLALQDVKEVTPKDLSIWRDNRLNQVSDSTVLLEMSFLSCAFNYAITELYIIENNPMDKVNKPKKTLPRHRRISNEEINKIIKWTKFVYGESPDTCRKQVGWCFLFAIETALRKGEILSLNKYSIFDNFIHIPMSKNGTSRDVPLTNTAKELLAVVEPLDDKLFNIAEDNFNLIWRRMLKQTGIIDLHFHDTRHEAISRMVRDLNIPVEKLAKITGHKSINLLVNTYYNPSVDELLGYFNA